MSDVGTDLLYYYVGVKYVLIIELKCENTKYYSLVGS